ncbi:MAG: tyrosine-type recombinase/integrase [Eubacteriales bacterium]|nr:tyrosine-type recombinase/integrase [Eubacteriales bacterium]
MKYEEGIQCLKQCWKEMGHAITDEEKAAMKSFRGVFVSGKSEPYSHEMALKWLSDNQLIWGEEKYQVHCKLIYELNDAVSTGTIKGEYKFLPTVYDSLPPDLKDQLILYRNKLLSHLQYRASRDQLIHCISFANFLKNQDIFQTSDITVELISKYHNYADTVGDTYICLYSVRYFLQFLVNHGIISEHIPYALTSPIQAKAAGYAIKRFSSDISDFETNGISCNAYWKGANDLICILRKEYHHDEDATRNNYLVYYQMFYVFMQEFSLPYTAQNVRLWVDGMKGFMSEPHRIPSIKRSFYLLDIFLRNGSITDEDLEIILCSPGKISELSMTYKNLLNDFLSSRRKENMAPATLDVHKSGALSFLLYMQKKDISAVSEISLMDVKEYCMWIAEKASNHKNNYSYDLRVFLRFCFEKDYVTQDISRALPTQSNQQRKIVRILSEEEIRMIYTFRDNAVTPLQLRDSAILMLGLLMGLRRIDVVNLKFSNIDWKAQTISITQQKTYRPLVLPMPTSVGNSIYKYIKHGRPKKGDENDYIFLSIMAPFKKADPSACGIAVKHALNNTIGSFHILRRTFASRLLAAGTKTDTIKDSLGHSTMDTINRYLSVDEEMLRSCCLPLERTVINYEATS